MRRIPSLIIPGLILIGCEALVQIHGWAFWRAHFHAQAGPALSVALGVLAAVWLAWAFAARGWAARLGCGLLGVVATAVLLAGPLYMVSRPLIEARTAADARPAELARLDAAMEARRAELARYLEITASGRYGWHGRIDDARLAIAELEAQRASLANATAAGLPWQTWAACGLQALALLLLQTGAASMAATCGRRWRLAEPVRHVATREEVAPAVETTSPVPVIETAEEIAGFTESLAESLTEEGAAFEEVEAPRVEEPEVEENHPLEAPLRLESGADEMTIRRLIRELERRITLAGSARKFCDAQGVNQREVSWLRNHFERLKKGEPTVSEAAIRKMARLFLVSERPSAAGGEA